MKQELKILLSKINKYYKLNKIAVPLAGDDVYIAKNHPRYSPEARVEDATSLSQLYTRKSLKDTALPPPIEFRRHYANTNLKYRIIFTGEGPITKGTRIEPDNRISTFNSFKQKLQYYANLKTDMREKSENTIKKIELSQHLLENFDNIFVPDAINIIANQLYESDSVTPEAIDHDLGHFIFNERIGPTDGAIASMFGNAIHKDYCIRRRKKNKHHLAEFHEEKEMISNSIETGGFTISDLTIKELISGLIVTNNPVPGSISSRNIENMQDEDILLLGVFNDSMEDLLMYYNKGGESFKDIKITSKDFYAGETERLHLNPNQDTKIMLTPKNNDGSIPNIESAIKKWFIKLEAAINFELKNLVGKIVYLW